MGRLRCHPLRSALLFGIWKGRRGNQVAGVGASKAGDVTFTHTGVHGAICGTGLVRKAGEVRLNEILLEVLARVPGHDLIAKLRRKLIEASPEHIEEHTRIEQCYFGTHVPSNARRGVQRNGLPHSLNLLLRDIVRCEELPSGICAVNLEALIFA